MTRFKLLLTLLLAVLGMSALGSSPALAADRTTDLAPMGSSAKSFVIPQWGVGNWRCTWGSTRSAYGNYTALCQGTSQANDGLFVSVRCWKVYIWTGTDYCTVRSETRWYDGFSRDESSRALDLAYQLEAYLNANGAAAGHQYVDPHKPGDDTDWLPGTPPPDPDGGRNGHDYSGPGGDVAKMRVRKENARNRSDPSCYSSLYLWVPDLPGGSFWFLATVHWGDGATTQVWLTDNGQETRVNHYYPADSSYHNSYSGNHFAQWVSAAPLGSSAVMYAHPTDSMSAPFVAHHIKPLAPLPSEPPMDCTTC